MSKEFLNAVPSYKPENGVETPYYRAKAEWDERIGSVILSARNWRVVSYLTSLLSLGLLGLSFILLSKNVPIPYVITVDRSSGEPTIFGKIGEREYVPKDPEITYFLSSFIKSVRGVPSDPVVIKRNWLEAYQFLRKEAANILNDKTNSDPESPLKKIGEETVTVQPISVIRVPDTNTFQARWSETIYTKNGAPLETYTMTGLFSIELEVPTSEKVLAINPLGIYITHFQWNREL